MKPSLEQLHPEPTDEWVAGDMKEKLEHGDKFFRMSVHKTTIPPMSNLVLYSHWHEEAELLFIEKGSARFYVGQEQFTVSSGEVVLIPPHVLHSASRTCPGEIVFYAFLVHYNFLSSLSNDQIQQRYITPFFSGRRNYPMLVTQEMEAGMRLIPVLEEAREVYQEKNQGYELLIKARLLEVLYKLEKCAAEQPATSHANLSRRNHSSVLAKKVIAYVQQNYSKPVTLSDMAQQVNMNPSYFCRFVKKQFDLSPMEFLNEYRIAEAVNLMETTDKKIIEIASQTGFSNVNRFTQIFKKYYGCTPACYRHAIVDCSPDR